MSHIRERMIEHKLSVRQCIWEKTNPSPMNGQHVWLSSIENCVFAKKSGATFNEHCKSAVWRNAVEHYKDHPTPKPVKLMSRLIEASSNIGDTVLDTCMGSGAIGVAAKQCGRSFIGIELNKEYYDMTEERLQSQTESVLNFLT